MKTSSKPIKTVDDYISSYDGEIKERLEALRHVIKTTIPNAIEDISYGMPAYRIQPGRRAFVFFGAATHHIGVYAIHENLSPDLQKRVEPYTGGRGTIQFANDAPLPLDLIEDILVDKRAEYGL